MLKEFLALIKIARIKFRYEKQEIEQRTLFLIVKGSLSLISLVFLSLSIFLWISKLLGATDLAALITSALFIGAYALVGLAYFMLDKYKWKQAEEKLNVFLPIIEAFFEGLAYEEKTKTQETTINKTATNTNKMAA